MHIRKLRSFSFLWKERDRKEIKTRRKRKEVLSFTGRNSSRSIRKRRAWRRSSPRRSNKDSKTSSAGGGESGPDSWTSFGRYYRLPRTFLWPTFLSKSMLNNQRPKWLYWCQWSSYIPCQSTRDVSRFSSSLLFVYFFDCVSRIHLIPCLMIITETHKFYTPET